jgi:uncharacterized repeat protein (TIGR02543 family)
LSEVVTVTFDLNFGSSPNVHKTVQAGQGGKISKPEPAPERAGYTLLGWREKDNKAYTKEWNFTTDKVPSDPPSTSISDIILYAKWGADAQTPVINTQPNVTTSISKGQTAALSVSVAPVTAGTLSYQWYSNTTAAIQAEAMSAALREPALPRRS